MFGESVKKKEAARSSSLIMSGRVRRLNSDWRDEAPDHDLLGIHRADAHMQLLRDAARV